MTLAPARGHRRAHGERQKLDNTEETDTMPLPAPTKARVAKLRAKLDAAIAEVYACGPDRNTRLSDCLALAPFDIESRYHNALHDLEEAEREAVATGRAFRASNTYGMLIWKR